MRRRQTGTGALLGAAIGLMVGLFLFQLALLFVLLTCLAGTLVGASVGTTRVRQRGPSAAALSAGRCSRHRSAPGGAKPPVHRIRLPAREMIDRVTTPTTLTTERLILRPWRESDLEPFAALNADPQVMRFFPNRLDRDASDAMARRLSARVDENGWGLWAAEVKDVAPFIGFIGLQPIPFDAHFTPAVEVGWRLDQTHWGRGYAPEGARAALEYAFDALDLDEVVSMTIPANLPSQRVMQKLGLTHDPADDFDHPKLPDWEHRRHILYRITRRQWAAR